MDSKRKGRIGTALILVIPLVNLLSSFFVGFGTALAITLGFYAFDALCFGAWKLSGYYVRRKSAKEKSPS